MTSRVLGVVREQVLAYYFGAGDAMDAFKVAYRVPNLLRDLFAEGAMSAAFVPTFARALATGGKPSAFRLGAYVVSALLLITGVVAVLGMVFAEPLVRLFASDYGDVPGKLELTVLLTRIMLPFLTFVALAAAFMGMLNALHHFFVPAVSPAMFNVGSIVCTVGLIAVMPQVGLPAIAAVAIGTIVGGLAQWLVQWPLLRREGFRYRPVLDWRDEGLRRVLLLMGPGTIGLAATQVNVFVNTLLATREGTGAVSWLDAAFRLMYLPIGLFGVSIATATTPAISRMLAQGDGTQVKKTIADGLLLMMILNVPATVGLIALAEPIVRLMYERGVHALRHDRRGRGAAVLCDRSARLLGGAHRLASLLCARSEPRARDRQLHHRAGQRRAQLRARAGDGVSRPGARHVDRGAAERGAAASDAAATAGRHRRRSHHQRAAAHRIAAALMGAAAVGADAFLAERIPGNGIAAQLVRVGATIGLALAVLAVAAHVLRVPQFAEAVSLIKRRLRRN